MTAFRAATPADVDAVVALVQLAYRGDGSRAGWTTEADLLDGQRTDAAQVLEAVTAPGSTVLLTHDGDGLLACCQVELREPGTAYVGMVAVRPRAQGAGTGRAVLAAAQAHARTAGAVRAEMTVIAQRTELVAFYERCGWVRTGQRRPFPHGDPRFGVPRRSDLEFVVLARALG